MSSVFFSGQGAGWRAGGKRFAGLQAAFWPRANKFHTRFHIIPEAKKSHSGEKEVYSPWVCCLSWPSREGITLGSFNLEFCLLLSLLLASPEITFFPYSLESEHRQTDEINCIYISGVNMI